MLVLIRNYSCDDTATGLAEFKSEEKLYDFIKIIIDLNNNAQYSWTPQIGIYKIDYDKIRPVSLLKEAIHPEKIVYLNNEPYTFTFNKYEEIQELEKDKNDLIKFYKEIVLKTEEL